MSEQWRQEKSMLTGCRGISASGIHSPFCKTLTLTVGAVYLSRSLSKTDLFRPWVEATLTCNPEAGRRAGPGCCAKHLVLLVQRVVKRLYQCRWKCCFVLPMCPEKLP